MKNILWILWAFTRRKSIAEYNSSHVTHDRSWRILHDTDAYFEEARIRARKQILAERRGKTYQEPSDVRCVIVSRTS